MARDGTCTQAAPTAEERLVALAPRWYWRRRGPRAVGAMVQGGIAGVVGGAVYWAIDRLVQHLGGPPGSWPILLVSTMGVGMLAGPAYLALSGTVATWRRLRRFREEHDRGGWLTVCPECGSDLPGGAGEAPGSCPECGSSAIRTEELRPRSRWWYVRFAASPARPLAAQVLDRWAKEEAIQITGMGLKACAPVVAPLLLLLAVAVLKPTLLEREMLLGLCVLSVVGIGTAIYILATHRSWQRERIGAFVGRYAHQGRLGLCLECGYDLRGSLEAGIRKCPECGRPATRVEELRAEMPWLGMW